MSLPKGWVEINLEEVVDVLDAQRVPINNTERAHRVSGKDKSELFPYYGATGNTGYIDDYLFDEELVLLGEDGVPFFDPLKHKAYIISGKTWVNNHAHVLRAKQSLTLNAFLTYFLNQFDYHGYVNGATRLKLNQTNMKKIPFVLPPLNEQKRIAKKLDELLATVESIKTRLDKAPTIIKRFRQSILAAATSGKLTEKWREENKVSDFKDEVLGSLLEHSANGLSKRSGTEGDEIVVLRLADYKNGIRAKGKERTILMTEKEQNKYILDKGDILVVRVNGSKEIAGLFTIYSGENEAYCDHFIRLSLDTNVVLPEYVMYIANEGEGRNYIRHKLVSNAGQNTINQKSLFGLTIPLPSLEEQKEIVSQVESLFSLADTLEEKIEAAKKRVDKLTQSILAKAFKGELIPQDPNDEPAEMLLERIKAEQEKEKPKKTRKKK